MAKQASALSKLLNSRQLRYGTNAVILSLAVIGILVLLNILAADHRYRYDATRNKQFSLTPQTISLLERLEEEQVPVEITAFFPEGTYERYDLKQLLESYEYHLPEIQVQFIDPDKNPGLASKYGIESNNTIVVQVGEKRKQIPGYELYSYAQYGPMSGVFQGEQALTRALLSLLEREETNIYFLSGHKEKQLSAEYMTAKSFLEGEGYNLATLNLAEAGEVPEDASLLIIAGPQVDLTEEEARALSAYLAGSGRMMLLFDPIESPDALPNWREFAKEWGIILEDTLVVDPQSHYFTDPLSPIPRYEHHPITDELASERLGIVFPDARSLRPIPDADGQGLEIEKVLVTTESAWGERFPIEEVLEKDPDDVAGPLTLGLAVTKTLEDEAPGEASTTNTAGEGAPEGNEDQDTAASEEASGDQAAKEMRLLVLGSASFADNNVLTFQGNVDFFMNATAWLLGQSESITIRPKTADFEQVQLTGRQMNAILYGTSVAMPLFVLLIGGYVWYRRRSL